MRRACCMDLSSPTPELTAALQAEKRVRVLVCAQARPGVAARACLAAGRVHCLRLLLGVRGGRPAVRCAATRAPPPRTQPLLREPATLSERAHATPCAGILSRSLPWKRFPCRAPDTQRALTPLTPPAAPGAPPREQRVRTAPLRSGGARAAAAGRKAHRGGCRGARGAAGLAGALRSSTARARAHAAAAAAAARPAVSLTSYWY